MQKARSRTKPELHSLAAINGVLLKISRYAMMG
jgi:hypothetical protein